MEWLGLIAGCFTVIGIFTQVIRVYRLKSAFEISWLFGILFMIGLSCWIIYGIYWQRLSIIVWNSIALMIIILLLIAKFRFGKHGT